MVDFSELWNNHPSISGPLYPCSTLGVPNFENQAAIRLGVCLRRSGVRITALSGVLTCSQAKLTNHPSDEMHFIRAKELANSLRRANIEGIRPVHSVPSPDRFVSQIGGRTGIIFINGYWWRATDTSRPTGDHIDLWNGWRTTTKLLFPWWGWYGGYEKSAEIWFWEVM